MFTGHSSAPHQRCAHVHFAPMLRVPLLVIGRTQARITIVFIVAGKACRSLYRACDGLLSLPKSGSARVGPGIQGGCTTIDAAACATL